MMASLQDIRNINDPQHKDYQLIHMALASYNKYPHCFSSHFCWRLETTWGLLQTLVNLEVKMSDNLMLFWTSFIIFLLLWERKTKEFNLIYLSCPISRVQFFVWSLGQFVSWKSYQLTSLPVARSQYYGAIIKHQYFRPTQIFNPTILLCNWVRYKLVRYVHLFIGWCFILQ